MKILQTLTFRVQKEATDGDVFDRVSAALGTSGYDPSNIRFYLEEFRLHKTSAVDRVLKVFPQLEPFRGTFEWAWEKQPVVMLSNNSPEDFASMTKPLSMSVTSQGAVAPEVLSEILHGVPRRFPFFDVKVLFDAVAPFNVANLRVHTLYQAFGVRLQLPPHGADYAINEHLPAVIANIAFVVQTLEETYVRDLLDAFGPAPAWFASWKTTA